MFILTLVAMGAVPAAGLHGEDAMLDDAFDLAENWPALAVPPKPVRLRVGKNAARAAPILAFAARS